MMKLLIQSWDEFFEFSKIYKYGHFHKEFKISLI
jgi:hypothetical protein